MVRWADAHRRRRRRHHRSHRGVPGAPTRGGRADELWRAMTIPALALACEREARRTSAVRAVLPERAPGGPLFPAPALGMTGLVRALVRRLRDAVRTGQPVRALWRDDPAAGWRIAVGAPVEGETIEADGVVLATPGYAAARLLSTVDAGASANIGALR